MREKEVDQMKTTQSLGLLAAAVWSGCHMRVRSVWCALISRSSAAAPTLTPTQCSLRLRSYFRVKGCSRFRTGLSVPLFLFCLKRCHWLLLVNDGLAGFLRSFLSLLSFSARLKPAERRFLFPSLPLRIDSRTLLLSHAKRSLSGIVTAKGYDRGEDHP